MTKNYYQKKQKQKKINKNNSLVDGVSILSKITSKDIEKLYNLKSIIGTEAHYSDRYGWTLKRVISQ